MKELFNALAQYISDGRNRLSYRVSIIFITIILTILLDNFLGFSYHYRINNRLEELQKANAIIHDPLSDSVTKKAAVLIRQDMINRKNWFDYFFSRIASMTLNTNNTNRPAQIPIATESIKNKFLFFMSSGGIFFIIATFFFYTSVFMPVEKADLIVRLATGVYHFLAWNMGTIVLYGYLKEVPLIKGDLNKNYALNGVVQLAVLFIVVFILVRIEKRNTKLEREKKAASFYTTTHT